MNEFIFHGLTSLTEKCSCEATNIFGRNICRIFGKLKCDNCEYRKQQGIWWGVRHPRGGLVLLSEKPIKSSLGYLWGYPTMITHEKPIKMKMTIQGTSSVPIRKTSRGNIIFLMWLKS